MWYLMGQDNFGRVLEGLESQVDFTTLTCSHRWWRSIIGDWLWTYILINHKLYSSTYIEVPTRWLLCHLSHVIILYPQTILGFHTIRNTSILCLYQYCCLKAKNTIYILLYCIKKIIVWNRYWVGWNSSAIRVYIYIRKENTPAHRMPAINRVWLLNAHKSYGIIGCATRLFYVR